jgi:hypothetical protein
MDKEKLKQIRKLEKKINKMEGRIRRKSRAAWFDKNYSRTGQLSNSCCELDDCKIELIELNKKLKELT